MIGENNFERDVIKAMQRLAHSQEVEPGLARTCAVIMLTPFDPKRQIEGCSNGRPTASIYVPPRSATPR